MSERLAYPFDRPWRVGRKVGRTIYVQEGAEPSDDDMLIGLMDSEYLAEVVVDAVNAQHATEAGGRDE